MLDFDSKYNPALTVAIHSLAGYKHHQWQQQEQVAGRNSLWMMPGDSTDQHHGAAVAAHQQQQQQQLSQQQQMHLDAQHNAIEHQQQQDKQQQLGVGDVKVQAVEALNSAFCARIYSTALQHLKQHFNLEDVQRQFMDILDQDDPYGQPCSVAHSDANNSKNRYRDVVPYDHNRVCLPPLQHQSMGCAAYNNSMAASTSACSTPDRASMSLLGGTYISGLCGSGGGTSSRRSSSDGSYINASFMADPKLSEDQAALQCYIATQGPLPCTVADFWRMVALTNTSAIVMLTGLSDGSPTLGNSKPRCAPYFPDKEHDVLRLPGATVTCVHANSLDEHVHFRQLEVTWSGPLAQAAAAAPSSNPGSQLQPPQQQHQQQPQRLWINHYEYAGWPDYGVPPSSSSVLALCHALDGCRRAGCKIAVHCSAGVGRTGTFIAIDILLQRLHSLSLQLHGSVSAEDVIAAMDVAELVASLRKQRRGTVQTWEQYSFIWQAVVQELEELLVQQQQEQLEQAELAAAHKR